MKLGNAAWGFRETPLEKQLEITRDMDLSLLELSIANSPTDVLQLEATDDDIQKVKGLFAKYNIELSYAAASNDFSYQDEAECLKQLEKLKKVIDIAGKLNLKAIRVFFGFSQDSMSAERLARANSLMKEAAIYASQYDLELSIETHGAVEAKPVGVKHIGNTSTDAVAFGEFIQTLPDNVGINYDPANLWAIGDNSPYNFYKKLEDRINYVHLKDFRKIAGADAIEPVACGEGGLDWDEELSVLKNYDGPALIEYENVEDAEDGFRRSLAFLKEKMA